MPKRNAEPFFRAAVTGAGLSVLALIAAIAVFLLVRAIPAFDRAGWRFFTERAWFPDQVPPVFGIAALAFGTVLASLIAVAFAVPVALGSALFLTELAPGRVGRLVGYLVDLLAAVPSVVYGLWGVYVLVPAMVPWQRRLDDAVGGFLPFLHSRTGQYGGSIFVAGIVLAIMILPIIAAISREVFKQVPSSHREAALGLGATRWEVVRLAVLPYGRSGVTGAIMLGLGRALGETIAVALVLGASFKIDWHILEPGGNTIAANIATKFGESGISGREALIASGLVLFAITLAVNLVARGVVYRAGISAEGKP